MGFISTSSASSGAPTRKNIHAFEANAPTNNIWVYNNADNLCRYGTEVFDPSEAYDNAAASSSYTAPEDGLYHFEARIYLPSSGTGTMKFKRGGTTMASSHTLVPADTVFTLASDIYLSEGQTIQAYLYWSGGTEGWSNQSNQAYFKGYMIASA